MYCTVQIYNLPFQVSLNGSLDRKHLILAWKRRLEVIGGNRNRHE